MRHVHKLVNFILDFLFPRPEQVISIQNMTSDELIQKIPRARNLGDDGNKALFDYRNKLAKQAIWEIKYKKNKKMAAVFCEPLYEYILDELIDKALLSNFQKPIIVPIPISKNRLKERGYNQCSIIARELERIDGDSNFTLCEDALKKTKDSPSQTSVKNRKKRLQNIKGCFSVSNHEKIKGSNIILIDDVITTGATMNEASRILIEAGADQVICFAIAH